MEGSQENAASHVFSFLLRNWFCFSVIFFLFFIGEEVKAEVISLDGSWQYTIIDQDEDGEKSSFNQRYGLGWNPWLTRAISFDLNMNYSQTVTSDNNRRESLSPGVSFQIENDLFLAELSSILNDTRNSESYDQEYMQWEAFFSSHWDHPLWPRLSYSLGKNSVIDDEHVHVTDNEKSWTEFITEWDYEALALYYSYYTELREDHVQSSEYDEIKHFNRAEYNRSFFDDRLNCSMSWQLNNSTTEFLSTDASGEDISILIGITQGLAKVDPTPKTGRLDDIPSLIDGNKNSEAFSIKPLDSVNIGVKADLRRVDKLYLYTGPIDPLSFADVEKLQFDLYSSDDGYYWNLEKKNPKNIYNDDNYRFEFEIGGLEKIYLKLVVTSWPATFMVPVTEIEAYRLLSGETDHVSTSDSYDRVLYDVNLRFLPSKKTSFSYGLVIDESDYETGNDTSRFFQTGTFRWDYSEFFSPSFSINTTSTENDISETNQQSYSLNIQSNLLPTLQVGAALSRNENEKDGEEMTTNHSVSLNANAELYPNLDSTLDITQNFAENEADDSSSDNLSLRWTVTARLRASLLIDFTFDYGDTETDRDEVFAQEENTERKYTLNVNWRPSDLLSILASGSKGTGDKSEEYERYLVDANFSLLRTSKTQVTIGVKINGNEEKTVNSINAHWSWNISEFLTMQTRASFEESDQDSWSVSTRLSTRF